ncbi:carbonic anhydrase [Blastopirellula marina]|uniref:carbonic anhydrase n=1 Tax=Blastopirellula marina TaxID=124 RepID=UPI001304D33D|nr:carbonic anhydrase [Blastopirellula marina]
MISLDPALHDLPSMYFGTASDFLTSAKKTDTDTLMIACSEQGSAPDNVSFARPGRFYVLQHIAASIPSAMGGNGNSVVPNIEFAFSQHDIKHVILCGHLKCGVIRSWMNDRDDFDFRGMRTRFEQTTLRAVNQAYSRYSGEERVKAMIYEYALFQMDHLCSHPFIQDKITSQELRLHVWIVNDDTARVSAYDPARGCFAVI